LARAGFCGLVKKWIKEKNEAGKKERKKERKNLKNFVGNLPSL